MYIKQLEDAMEKRLSPYVSNISAIAQKLVASYGAKGVQVVFVQQFMAATDNKTIWLPALKEVDWRSSALLRGFLLHEIGHIRHSDLDKGTYLLLMKMGARGIANSLEDVRQENLLISTHAGARRVLDDVGILVLGQEVQDMEAPCGTHGEGAQFFKNWVLIYGRCKHRGMSFLSRQSIALTSMVESIYGKKMIDQAKSLIDLNLPLAKSYQDVADLSLQLAGLFINQDDYKDDPSTDGSNDSESADEGEDNQPSEEGSSQDDGSDQNDGCANHPDELSDQDGETSDDASDKQKKQVLLEELKDDDSDNDACIGSIIASKLFGIASEVGVSDGCGEVCVYSEVSRSPFPSQLFDSMLSASKRGIALGQKLDSILQGMDIDRVKPSMGGARINSRRLAMHTTDSRVFLVHDQVEAKSVEVGVLLDLSNSMRVVLPQLKHGCSSLHQAMKFVGCSYWIDGFEGQRIVGITNGHEDMNSAISKIGSVNVGGCTPTGQAVEHAIARFGLSKADQKHLIILTDGDPDDMERARKALEESILDGIKVSIVGYGEVLSRVEILLGKLSHGLNVSCKQIDDISQFESVVFSVVKDAVITSKRGAA
jgi:hypothetical protein